MHVNIYRTCHINPHKCICFNQLHWQSYFNLNQTPKLGKFYQVTQTRQTINNSGDHFKCIWKMLSKLCEFQIITSEKMNSEQRMTCDQTCWQAYNINNKKTERP